VTLEGDSERVKLGAGGGEGGEPAPPPQPVMNKQRRPELTIYRSFFLCAMRFFTLYSAVFFPAQGIIVN
jgi:hypothetical protein